uniref:Uncharacterized protein n=1 Tax=Amycolatopsis mediterranei TaxID=33910 RepID=B2XSE0_AMYMD|nr:hypothetical protein amp122 [Amycolatopsis mediterranei]
MGRGRARPHLVARRWWVLLAGGPGQQWLSTVVTVRVIVTCFDPSARLRAACAGFPPAGAAARGARPRSRWCSRGHPHHGQGVGGVAGGAGAGLVGGPPDHHREGAVLARPGRAEHRIAGRGGVGVGEPAQPEGLRVGPVRDGQLQSRRGGADHRRRDRGAGDTDGDDRAGGVGEHGRGVHAQAGVHVGGGGLGRRQKLGHDSGTVLSEQRQRGWRRRAAQGIRWPAARPGEEQQRRPRHVAEPGIRG